MTPGPWKRAGNVVAAADGMMICSGSAVRGPAVNAANLDAIAALPDLVRVLEALVAGGWIHHGTALRDDARLLLKVFGASGAPREAHRAP